MAASQDETQSKTPAATLHILLRDGTLIERELIKAETTLGKGTQNDILLADPSVSGAHAMIRLEGGNFVLTDIGSRNGTYLNDSRISEPRQLQHGDLVRMGHCTITFRMSSQSGTGAHERTQLLDAQPPPPPAPPAPNQSPVTEDSVAQALVGNGLLAQSQVALLRETGAKGRRLCRAVIEDRLVTETALRQLLRQTFNLKAIDLNSSEVDAGAANALRAHFLRERLVCPVVSPDVLILAVFDPTDQMTIDEVERITRRKVSVRLATASEIAARLDQHFTPRLIGALPTGEKIQAILNNVETELGKAPHNRVVISDPTVSNTHAIVLARDGGYNIVDLGSSNGTFINGQKLGSEAHTLQHGDKIQLGQVVLTFRNPAETTENKTARLSVEALEEVRRRALSGQIAPSPAAESGPEETDEEREERKKKKKKDKEAAKNSWFSPNAISRILAQVLGSLVGLFGSYYLISKGLEKRAENTAPPVTTAETVVVEKLASAGEWRGFSTGFLSFKKIEASGVSNVPGSNSVLIVTDNGTSEVLWMNVDTDGKQSGDLKSVPLGVSFKDPEAITYGNSFFYVATSQSEPADTTSNSILRFGFNAENQTLRGRAEIITNFRSFLLSNVTEISSLGAAPGSNGGLNIEGLAWDPNNERLLVGLRSPMIGNQAVLVPLRFRDPRGPFTAANLKVDEPRVIVLSLAGHGIRDITYDSRLKDFLILSGAPETAPRSEFGLWLWNGRTDSKPVKLLDLEDKRKPEGVTNISVNGKEFILVVGDAGGYLKLDYAK